MAVVAPMPSNYSKALKEAQHKLEQAGGPQSLEVGDGRTAFSLFLEDLYGITSGEAGRAISEACADWQRKHPQGW